MKRGLEVYSDVQVGALRISIAFIFLLFFTFKGFKTIKKGNWKWIFITGIVGNVIPAFMFAYAQTGIDSSLAGILNSLTPLFTLIIGISFFKHKTKVVNVLGVIIAFIGAVGLLNISGGENFEFNFGFGIFIIIATVCYAINVNIIKSHLQEVNSIFITVFAIVTTGFPILIYLLFFTDFIHVITMHPHAWEGLGYIAILAIFGTSLALMLFYKLVQLTSPVFSSSVTYLIPVVAIILGIIDGEEFGVINVLWISLILLGVFLVNKKESQFFPKKIHLK